MPQDLTITPVRGAYLVDTSAATEGDPFSVAAWTGRMQRVWPDGRYVLITATGYEWPARPERVRAATDAEREVFARDAEALRREVADVVRRMMSGRAG